MKIRTQLILSTAALILAFAVLGVSMVVTSGQVTAMEQQREIAGQVQVDAYSLEVLTDDYLQDRGDRQEAQWNAEYAVLSFDLDRLGPAGPDGQALVENIRSDKQHLKEIFADISGTFDAMETSGVQPDSTLVSTSGNRMAVASQGVIDGTMRLSAQIKSDADRVRQVQALVLFAMLGVILAIILANYFLVYRRLLSSIADLRRGTEVIGSGDLTHRIPEKGDDEFRELAASFNSMAASRKQAEEDLLDRDSQMRNIIESLPAAMVYSVRVSPDGNRSFTFVRGAVKALHNCTPEEAMADASRIYGTIAEDEKAGLRANEAQAAAGFETFHEVIRIRTPDNQSRWVYAMSRPRTRFLDGSVLFDGVELDITDLHRAEEALREKTVDLEAAYEEISATEEELRKNYDELAKNERELRESESRYRELFDTIPVGVSRSTPGPGGKILIGNPAVLRIFEAKSIEELLATPPENLYADPDDRTRFVDAMVKNGMVAGLEVRYKSCRGRPFWGRIGSRKGIAADGSVYFANTVEDITDKKQAEAALLQKTTDLEAAYEEITATEEELRKNYDELARNEKALRESESRYRNLFENMTDGFVLFEAVADEKGNPVDLSILAGNHGFETTTGLKIREVSGKRLTEVLPGIERDAADWIRTYGTVALTGESRQLEQGSEYLGSYYLVTAYQAAPGQCAVVFSDITAKKKAEAALKESEERFRQLFTGNQAVMLMIEPESGKIIDANPTAAAFYGYPRDVLVTMDIGAINQLDPAEVTRLRHQIAEKGRQSFVAPHRLRDGSIRTVEVHSSPIRIKDRIILFSIVHDVTEREAAKAALTESEERFRDLFEKNYTVMLEIDPSDGRILDANPAASAFYGYPRDVLCHMNVPDINTLPPEGIAGILSRVRDGELHLFEVPHRLADGTSRMVEIFATPVITKGRPRLIAIIHDITERKRTEAALLESEEKFRTLVETAYEGIWILDADYRITFANPRMAEMLGYAPEEMIGRSLESFISLDELGDHKKVATGQKAGSAAQFERKYLRRNGSVCWALVSAVPITKDGTFAGVFATAMDITQRKQAEKEREAMIRNLEEKNAEMERFVYTISHDLKTPLITILGYAGLLEEDLETGKTEELRSCIDRITAAGKKMDALLADVLQLSRIGRVALPSEKISMTVIAREAADLVAISLQQRGAEIGIDPDMPEVYVDRNRIREVLVNLVENAVKYTGSEKHPRIRIGAKEQGGAPVFFVQDNGMGIDPAYLERIFNLFEKLDPKSPGTGAGLAIVKRIIEVHGGRIWAESRGGGQGSTFFFTLPAADPQQ